MKKLSIPTNIGFLILVFSILIFSFGYWTESYFHSVNEPRHLIQNRIVPFFYPIRNLVFLFYLSIFIIYCIILKTVPKLSPFIYILTFMHFLMALKITFYEGSFTWMFLEGFVGIYIIGFFFALLVKHMDIDQIRASSLAAILLTFFFAFLSINPANGVLPARWQFHFSNPNLAGTAIVAIYCFYNIFYQPKKNIVSRLLFLVLTISAFLLTIMTGSRTAISGLALLFILKSQKTLSVKFIFICVLILALFILYAALSTDIWTGRDNRLTLWYKYFSDPSYSILYGSDYFLARVSFEGFFVSLPYTLGLIGILILGLFLLQLLLEILNISMVGSSHKELHGSGHFLIVLSWMSIFESIFYGVLTPTMIIFVFLIAWISKELNSIAPRPS